LHEASISWAQGATYKDSQCQVLKTMLRRGDGSWGGQEYGSSPITCPYNGQGAIIGAARDRFAAKTKEAQCSVPQCGSELESFC